jgi:urease accessory protein
MQDPTVSTILRAGSWDPAAATDTIRLDHDGRHRRRIAMTAAGGTRLLLDLAQASVLHDGDGLPLGDGRIVRVEAAPEPLAELTAPDEATLLRLAWHLGNRHLPAMLSADRILIRRDHVVEAMAGLLGAAIRHVERAFDPEAGAYSGHGH